MRRWLPALALLALAGCTPPSPPAYMVGPPWQGDHGVWFYPAESFSADQTGLAAVITDHPSGQTADHEAYDPAALAAAHQTLQLPAIAQVTNLQTGLQLTLRINDRGPTDPGRLIGLTPRAAQLLGVPAGGVAQVRVQVLTLPSQQLAAQLGGGPAPVAAVPVGTVTADELAPPAGVTQSDRGHRPAAPQPASAEPTPEPIPDRLPEAVVQTAPRPGRLYLDAGRFDGAQFANFRQARLAFLPARVERSRVGRQTSYRVVAGPFRSVEAADAALDRALDAGVPDARIVVE